MAKVLPTKIIVRAYKVGFGDCLLLTFVYGKDQAKARHVLIDCGSTGLKKAKDKVKDKDKDRLLEVANDIKARTDGHVHAIVVTHRHKDHVNGFAGESGEVLKSLNPQIVLQPWTEDPQIDPKAQAPSVGHAIRTFAASLKDMHSIAQHAISVVKAKHLEKSQLGEQLTFLGETNLANLEEIKAIQALPGKHYYLAFNDSSHLERLLPGVKVSVLGPPTLKQDGRIGKQNSKNKKEYWHLYDFWNSQAQSFTEPDETDPLFAKTYITPNVRPEARWIKRQLKGIEDRMLLQIVRSVDNALNNTSLILLFEIGSKKVLFSGDAQWENWRYALETASKKYPKLKICERLAAVDLYKVGHHGSLNGTPKTLWDGFEKRGDKKQKDRLLTVCSTLKGVHGKQRNSTEVPREILVNELLKQSTLYSTTLLKPVEQNDDDVDGMAETDSVHTTEKGPTLQSITNSEESEEENELFVSAEIEISK